MSLLKRESFYNLIAVTDDAKNKARIESICTEFNFSYKIYNSVEDLTEKETSNFILIFSAHNGHSEMSGYVQTAKYINPGAFIIALVSKHLDPESSEFIKRSGAAAILLEEELYTTSKVEFLSIQSIRSTYAPVKISELKVGSILPFSLYYMMPVNQKYIKANQVGFVVTDEWKSKMELRVVEMYIHRDEIPNYYEYLSKSKDNSVEGNNSRCRAAYLNLHKTFVQLIILLSDQSETNSFAKGKDILNDCVKICDDLLSIMSSIDNPLLVINTVVEGDFGSLERTPGQAAIAGLIAMNSGINASSVMLGILINNLGLIVMPYHICKKIKDQEINKLSSEDLLQYHRHPITSINLALSRKLPLEDSLKDIIMCSHEQLDGKGFPNKIIPERISEEAQLIQFNEELDLTCIARMGKPRKFIKEEFNRMTHDYLKKGKYSPFFIHKIKTAL